MAKGRCLLTICRFSRRTEDDKLHTKHREVPKELIY